jgi:nicotinamide-nucleotide amidase
MPATLDPAARLHRLLRERGSTVATAESLTGGRLAALLTAVPGASATYVGGVVTYATELKVSLLGVPAGLVEEHGVVSAVGARALGAGPRRVLGATYALSTTGVAGPDRQEGHPAGTVFVGLAGPGGAEAVPLELAGDRHTVQDATCRHAVALLLAILVGEETSLR